MPVFLHLRWHPPCHRPRFAVADADYLAGSGGRAPPALAPTAEIAPIDVDRSTAAPGPEGRRARAHVRATVGATCRGAHRDGSGGTCQSRTLTSRASKRGDAVEGGDRSSAGAEEAAPEVKPQTAPATEATESTETKPSGTEGAAAEEPAKETAPPKRRLRRRPAPAKESSNTKETTSPRRSSTTQRSRTAKPALRRAPSRTEEPRSLRLTGRMSGRFSPARRAPSEDSQKLRLRCGAPAEIGVTLPLRLMRPVSAAPDSRRGSPALAGSRTRAVLPPALRSRRPRR